MFKKTLTIINAQVSQVNTYNDEKTPDLSLMQIDSLDAQNSGLVKFTATHPNPLKC
jgi:hypothetical protein